MDETGSPFQAGAGVAEGDVLAGKFRVDRVLGVGGMGVVVAAHHLQLDEKVALKFLRPEALTNAQAVARFDREARAAVKIKSEHVARVIDVGKLDNGAPYMVMEFLEGGDLCAWLAQRGALPVEQAVEFVLQACEAIAEAHGLGIVHRDLKPANLFCIRRPDGLLSIKVLDFGISKVTNPGDSGPSMQLTKTQAVMGSPYYMSPEQMASAKDVDARTDIWALGTILYELVSRRVPFEGTTLPELVLKIVGSAPPPLRELRPEVPEALEAVILRCLEKDRANRFPNVAELAVALAPFGPKRARASVERVSRVIQTAGLSTSALALPPSTDDSPPTATTTTANPTAVSWEETAPVVPRRSRAPIFAVGAVLALGVLAGLALVVRAAWAPKADTSAADGLASPVVSAAAAPAPAPEPKPEDSRDPKAEPVVAAPAPSESALSMPSAAKPPVGKGSTTRVGGGAKEPATVNPDKPAAKPEKPPEQPAAPAGAGGGSSLGGRT